MSIYLSYDILGNWVLLLFIAKLFLSYIGLVMFLEAMLSRHAIVGLILILVGIFL